MLAPFGVANDHPPATEIDQHFAGDLAGPGTGLLCREVLRAQGRAAAAQCRADLLKIRKWRTHQHVAGERRMRRGKRRQP